jgi:hypothetical protein
MRNIGLPGFNNPASPPAPPAASCANASAAYANPAKIIGFLQDLNILKLLLPFHASILTSN